MPELTPHQIREEIIDLATRLFSEGKIDYFLAYGKGTVPFKTTPLIAQKKEDLQGVWVEDYFAANLALYLKEIRGRIGILVKGCDSRSLVSLIKEGQIRREDLYVVGISCPGQIHPPKLATAAGCELEDLEEIRREDSEVLIRVQGREKRFPKTSALLNKCLFCQYPQPVIFDSLLPGAYQPPVAFGEGQAAPPLKDDLRGKPPGEKWAFWSEQFERCLRCYACRNVCPACFCPRCLVEENMPQWVSPLPSRADNFVFHMMRLMHVAGTCTSCGECERICPMEIPLMKLNEKMAEDIRELYDFVAGVDLEKPLPLRTYLQEDRDDFIK